MSDDGTYDDEPTGEFPVASTNDSRVTITGAEIASELVDDAPEVDPTTFLPHWTDAPTGQVPIVVAREAAHNDDPWSAIPAPAWREGEADWVAHEDQFDASILAGDEKTDDARPWEFTLPEAEVEEETTVEAPRPAPVAAAQHTRHRVSSNPLAGRAVRQSASSSVTRATGTGVLLAIVVFAVFLAGPLPVTVLLLAALAFASAEAYAGFRTLGAHPATILGIVAVLTLGVAVYNKGLVVVGAVTVLLVIFGFFWYMSAKSKIDVLDGIGATIFVYVWVGVLGSYGVLMLAPNTYPDRHGIAYLFGAVALTISNDVGALFVGRWIGRRPLNRVLSPNKTVEGTIGGTIITLIAGAVILPMVSPWTLTHGLEAAVALSIVVPLGDLFESMVKRTLGVKDLGRLLPGHGGLLDRMDGLLFALPTMYYLLHVLKLS
ncbi:MAG TPA: phosphatidate cytidylyltransferase [Acidimicrobiales bacterium]|nr:phosphatidate cytidylyltransferase [Acidimicrobiales bacterium]